jgi:hypothetical protein
VDVALIDAIAAGWPEHVCADVMVTIRSRPDWHCAPAGDSKTGR